MLEINFTTLNQAQQAHLLQLISDRNYRNRCGKENYDYEPDPTKSNGSGRPIIKRLGTIGTKFGWTAALPAGSATRGAGPDPGKNRIYRLQEFQPVRTTWWKAEHVPGNMYKFTRITNIPSG